MTEMRGRDKLRVGIVGCGYQGGRLAEAIALTDSMVVTACTDVDQPAAERLAESAGLATVYGSTEELLAGPVDVVMVATPHHLLANISLKALEAGKHVLCEKPIGLSESEVMPIAAAVARTGLSYLAGYSFRYIPAWQRIKQLLVEGVVGEIVAVQGAFGLGPMSEGWIADPRTGGGPLYYLGSHLIDQILWYVGCDPVEVHGDVHYRPDTGADETSAFTIRFSSGAVAQCLTSQAASKMFYSLQIEGRQGRISMQPTGFLEYDIKVVSSVAEEFKQESVLHPTGQGDPRNVMHCPQLEEFAAAIAARRQPSLTVQDGRRVLQVIDAVFASAQAGAAVRIA